MSLSYTSGCRHFSEIPFTKRNYTRRPDLTDEVRLNIGVAALSAAINKQWGTITHLAKQYNASRTFIYFLKNGLNKVGKFIFNDSRIDPLSSTSRENVIETMLSLRMEGGCSIGSISTIMKRQGLDLSSTGSISQTLSAIGGLLPMTMTIGEESIPSQFVVFANDELYSKSFPILITADPISSCILRMKLSKTCTGMDWKNHLDCLDSNGIKAAYMVSDEGSGLCAGQALAVGDVVRQSDTYHAIAHTLGSWVNRLETSAYGAISYEYKRWETLESAKSERVREEREAKYALARERTAKEITKYESFTYIYQCIIGELNVFDSDGNLRDKQQSEENIGCGLTLMAELNHPKITDAVNKVRRTLKDLFHYFDFAKEMIEECKTIVVDEDSLKAYCVAWQWGKSVRKSKNCERKNGAIEQEIFCLEIAENLNQLENEEDNDRDIKIKREVYSRLDRIIQSSAMVECINSIIRPYLNTGKNNVIQEQLNLLMHYHNHRRYRDGVRKGKTPMEILTGKDQTKDWIEILFDIITKKDPALLLAS